MAESNHSRTRQENVRQENVRQENVRQENVRQEIRSSLFYLLFSCLTFSCLLISVHRRTRWFATEHPVLLLYCSAPFSSYRSLPSVRRRTRSLRNYRRCVSRPRFSNNGSSSDWSASCPN